MGWIRQVRWYSSWDKDEMDSTREGISDFINKLDGVSFDTKDGRVSAKSYEGCNWLVQEISGKFKHRGPYFYDVHIWKFTQDDSLTDNRLTDKIDEIASQVRNKYQAKEQEVKAR